MSVLVKKPATPIKTASNRARKKAAQLFPRSVGKNGLAYESKADHTFALICLTVGFDLPAFDDFLEKTNWSTSAAKANLQWFIARRSQAIEAARANDRKLLRAILETLQIARQLVESDDVIRPLAQLGSKFKQGRKQGTKGPLRIAVENLVKKDPKISAANAWQTLKQSAPAQMEFTGSRPELREVWLKNKKLAEWPYFQKLLSLVKSELK